MSLNHAWPHTVDVLVVDDTGTGERMGRAQLHYLERPAVRCRVNERAPERKMFFDREETVHAFRVHFPTDPGLTVAHLLVWQRTANDWVYMQVKGLESPLDGGRWLPWVAYCELDRSAEPPATSTAGLALYTPQATEGAP